MNFLPHLAARIFGRPLLAEPEAAARVVAVLADRLGADLVRLGGTDFSPAALAEDARARPRIRREYRTAGGVAVVPIVGSLVSRSTSLQPSSGLTGYSAISEQTNVALNDPEIRGVLLEIDSPGGEASGAFDLARQIRAAAGQKPVWASANEQALSAGYAIGSAAARLAVARSGEIGSVGVVALHTDISGELAQKGRRVTILHAGARKAAGHPFAPLDDEATHEIQARLDDLYAQFVTMVAEHRGIAAEAVRATEARILLAPAARELGLVDAVEPFEETLARLQEHVAAKPPRPAAPAAPRPPAPVPDPLPLAAGPARAAASPPAAAPAIVVNPTLEVPMSGADIAAERERLAAIFGHGKAADQKELVNHLALRTSLPAADALAILDLVKGGGNQLDAAMRRLGNPRVGPDDGAGGLEEDVDAVARRIAGYSRS
jgi:signal peptide peptidase SppA